MINQNEQALIHASIDGELDEAELAELEQLLESSEEARHFHSELNRLSAFLDKIPDHELPEGLHAKVTENIPLPVKAPLKSIFSFSGNTGMFRFGLAAAAALVLTVALIESRDQWSDPADINNMTGTIARAADQQLVDRYELDSSGHSAELTLGRQDDQLVLDLRMLSNQALEFEIDLTGTGLAVSAMVQPPAALEYRFDDEGRQLSGEIQGQEQFLVVLDQAGGEARQTNVSIGVTFFLNGKEIDAGTLSAGG